MKAKVVIKDFKDLKSMWFSIRNPELSDDDNFLNPEIVRDNNQYEKIHYDQDQKSQDAEGSENVQAEGRQEAEQDDQVR